MTDPDEIEEQRREYESLREQLLSPGARARLAADGRDADAEVKRLDELFQNAAAAVKDSVAADERSLQSAADAADSMRAAYHGFKQMIAEVEREDPLNPSLEQAREFLEAWSERMPKDEQ
jgi:hypothetical protein